MELTIALTVIGLLGWLIYTMAEKRNRNAWAWTVLSILTLPIGGVLLLLLLGDLPKTETKD